MASRAFEPGLSLAEAFYHEVLRPAVGEVPHSAALLGHGSDVLGLDSERSTDHNWGPRGQLFVPAEHVAGVRQAVERALPDRFRGWPTGFGADRGPETYRLEVTTLDDWLQRHLGFVPAADLDHDAWLATPQQLLLAVT